MESYDVRVTAEFSDWLDDLRDETARRAVAARLVRASNGVFGDHKFLEGGLSELRIHHGPGYRVYYVIRGRTVVIVLVGGSKQTQDRDIARARRLAKDLEV